MFDLKREFEKHQTGNDETVSSYQPTDAIDAFLTTCTALDYEREYEDNIQMLEKFHDVDITLTKFEMDVKNGSVNFETALSSLNDGLDGTGFTTSYLGLDETMCLESALLTVESGESWFVRIWNWIKQKIKGLYDWFMGLFKSNDAKLSQAEAAINKVPSPEELKNNVAKVKKGLEEKNKELIVEANKNLTSVMQTAKKIEKEMAENSESISDATKLMEDMQKELDLKLSNKYPVYWKNVKNIPGALIIADGGSKTIEEIGKHMGYVFNSLSDLNKLYRNIAFSNNTSSGFGFDSVKSGPIKKDSMLPEVKKITDYIKKLDNKSPYSEKYGIESSSKSGTYLTSFISAKNVDSISTMAFKLDEYGLPVIVEETFTSKKTYADDYVLETSAYKEAYDMGMDFKKTISKVREEKRQVSKNIRQNMEIVNKKINASNEGTMEKDAMDLFTKALKSSLGSMKYQIKHQVARTNYAILITRIYLEFMKANTVKL